MSVAPSAMAALPTHQHRPVPEEEETAGAATWRMLSVELMPALQHEVLSRMPAEDKRSLRLACHAARALVDASVRVIQLQWLADTPLGAETQARAFSSFPNVTTLLLRAEGLCTQGMRHFLSLNASLMRRLKRIEADRRAMLMSETWDVILEACDPSLLQVWAPCVGNRRLRPFVNQVLRLANHPGGCGLTELDLSLSKVADKDLETITRRCRNIKVLDLTACTALSDEGVRHCHRLLGLTSLTLDKTTLTCESFADLSGLHALTRLHLGWCQGMTPQGCRAVAGLPAVRHLTITKHPYTFPVLRALAEGRISGTLQHLALTGSNFDPPAWSACAEVVRQLPELRELDLSMSNIVQDGASISLKQLREHRHGRVKLCTAGCTHYKQPSDACSR